jgi:acyl-CoA synthetase (AMP-forming)/AMP-acid ligase II
VTAPPVLNIAAPLAEMARRQPETTALIEGGRRLSFHDLDAESDRLARGLLRAGVTRGTRAVLMVPPGLEFYALTFALFKLGAVVVLIDPGMGIRNLGACLAEAEPEAFLGVARAHLARMVLRWAKKTVRFRVLVGGGWLGGPTTLAQLRRLGEHGDPVLAPTTADETAAILFTSGSTGVAKGAVYTHGIFAAQVEMLRRLYGIEPGEIDLPTFPLFGLFGPALGMTCVIPQMDATRPGRVDPRAIVEPIRGRGVTNLFGSPALLRRIIRSGPLPQLRRVISAGAPVSPKILRQVAAQLRPGVQVHTPYGATEALPVATIGSDEILGETAALTARGKGVCVGRPVEGMRVKILRISDEAIPTWSDDLELPPREIGEIAVSGPVVTRGYYNRPDLTALHKIPDPRRGTFWHRMGDVGYLDDRGRVWFCGRKSQRVVTATGTLFTIPCEGVFNAHPQVLWTALVGVKRNGHVEPELCVEIDPELPRGQRPDRNAGTLAAFRGELADLGAKHDHTRAIRRFHVHPAFPVDIRHNAKIFREKLADWAARQAGGLA